MKESETYTKVLELFEDPGKWTQGVFARDSEGKTVVYDDPKAVCFCVFGACIKVDPSSKCKFLYQAAQAQGRGPVSVNDYGTLEDVREMLHRARDMALEAGQ